MEFNEKAYSIIISETVQEQLRGIKDYISANYFSEQAGANTVKNVLYGLERLEVFPEAGFDADERVGGIIYPPHKTRCIILGDYLAFYHILEDRKAVFVSDIIHSKQDYIRLFNWNVLIFIMGLTNEVKVQIYELRKQVQIFNQLSKRFCVDVSG